MNVFDASAILTLLHGEPGADRVKVALEAGGAISSINWSEVAQKVQSKSLNWEVARSALLGFPIVVMPVEVDDAEAAAARWSRGKSLSLADRLCLALGDRLEATVWTADSAWADEPRVELIRT